MEFSLNYYSKSTIKKSKKYQFNFSKEDVEEGMKRSFENPHHCNPNGKSSVLSLLFGLYKGKDDQLMAVMYHTYHVFEENKCSLPLTKIDKDVKK